MQFKKLALTLTLSAAFGLMACGDDSSSGPNNSDSGSELQKEFQEVQKEMMEGLEKLGKCTEDNAGEEKTITVKGKDYKVVCEDGEWESDELDNLIENYEKKLDEDAKKHIDGKGCNFKKTDKVWSYNVSTDLYDEGTTHIISMEIDGTTLIEKSTNTVTGGSISTACKYMSEDDMHDTEKIDETKTIETITECDGDKMIVTDITKTTNAVDEEHNRDFYFEQFMGDCKMINGIEDDEDDDDPSSSEEEDLSSSSNGNGPNVGPSGDEPDKPAKGEKDDEDDEMTVVCELEESADQWKVLLDYGYGGGTGKTWTWTSETSVTVNTFSYTETSSKSECEEMLQFTANASCDGTKFIKSVGEEKVEDTSKESMLASAQSTCDMYKTMIED